MTDSGREIDAAEVPEHEPEDEMVVSLRQLLERFPEAREDIERKIGILNGLAGADPFEMARGAVGAIQKWNEVMQNPQLSAERLRHVAAELAFLSTILARKMFLEFEPKLIVPPGDPVN